MNDDPFCDPFSPQYDPYLCPPALDPIEASADTPWVTYVLLGLLGIVILALILASMRIVQQYERGVVYRLGRVRETVRSPGLNFIIPVIERMVKVPMAIEALQLEPQQVITKDNVSLSVRAVVYFRVNDPLKAEVEVDDYIEAITLRGQSVLRQVIGASELEGVLSQSQEVIGKIQDQLEPAAQIWGLDVQNIELKDVGLPEGMQRAMAAQAEARREADAKVIAAEGELKSAEKLSEAASKLSPIALRLRELQTLLAIGAEQSTVIVVDSQQGTVAAQAAAGQIAAQRT